MDVLPVVQGRSRPVTVLNRLTVVTTDSSHLVSSAESNSAHHFSIINTTVCQVKGFPDVVLTAYPAQGCEGVEPILAAKLNIFSLFVVS